MVLNESPLRGNRCSLSPKLPQERHPNRPHPAAFASENPSNTARFPNDCTIVHSVDGHGDTLVVEDISAHDAGYDGDIEIVAPCEYEEAESRPSTPQQAIHRSRNDVGTDDIAKTGLIDAMRALDCDSDITDYGYRRLRIRGRKRKGGDFFSGQSTIDCSSDAESIEIVDLEHYGKVFTPATSAKPRKRRRRRGYTGDPPDSQNAEMSSVDGDFPTHVPYGINLNGDTFPSQEDEMDIG
ncbi:uncharacterized protein BDCG_03570 [Blastomyces dermatitidis ER-3]|uniref:Uncharacterized protein n=1 Tax=Ajellomyces dermatitidis (strain ER-3 / ATCC MYA-2586) TaxID=559297 RepID=A0ABP2EWL6_AJEDR|nr:uncharacterized protein BDCG_03570 [Blastomyces dermatitidis ER-3]EEQ88450.1 hypothetical protein BDCG_03570 [Blastomyces dermatitidis ER-3]